MKKILALVLTLAMVLSMFTMGFTVSAANTTKPADAPADAIAISDVDGLKNMEAGKYHYLTADITLGSYQVRFNEEDENGLVPLSTSEKSYYTIDPSNPGLEEDLITIPAGATLDGNGNTIYHGYYISNPGMFAKTNKYANSLNWTHSMFEIAAGDQITIKNLNIGSTEIPVYLSPYNKVGATGDLTSNDIWGIFDDTTGSKVVWENVDFYVERYGRGLGGFNVGPVMTKSLGTHNFTDCSVNTSTMSAGSQYGGWIYESKGPVTMTNCSTKGFVISAGTNAKGENVDLTPNLMGSVGAGFIHTAYADVTMKGCKNNVNITADYSGTGYKFGGLIGEMYKGSIYVENCENNGDISLNKITIGGGLVGRGQNGSNAKFQIINSTNNGDIKRSNAEGTTSNHGYGGIAGHVSATTTFEIIGCTNNGNITGATGNAGGILGLVEGNAPQKILKNNINNGSVSTINNIVEAAGIVAQFRTSGEISGCKNYGDITSPANYVAGIVGRDWTGGTVEISDCENHGAIKSTGTGVQVAGIMAYNSAATVTINNSKNFGKITTESTGDNYVAGFVAKTAKTLTITNSENRGEVTANDSTIDVAGLVATNTAAITINGSKNYGTITGAAATVNAAGLVAYAGAAVTINGSKNYGTITAGAATVAAAGFVADAAAAVTINGSQNLGTVTAAAATLYVAGLVANNTSTLSIENSMNHGAIAGSSKSTNVAGLVANTTKGLTINFSQNHGVITGANADASLAGIIAAYGTANLTFNLNNCKNFGAIGGTTNKYAGGMFARTAAGTYNLTKCENYGAITTKQYSGGMIAELSGAGTVRINGCYNYGEIQGVHAISGFVAQVASNASLSITIENSFNLGDIHQGPAAGEGIGGFLGRIAGFKPTIILNNCINLGTVTGSTKSTTAYGSFGDTFGQFIGCYTVNAARNYTGTDVADHTVVGGFLNWKDAAAVKPVLNNCHGYGDAVVAKNAKSLKGWVTAEYVDGTLTNLTQSTYKNNNIPVAIAPNGGVAGINVEYTGDVKTLLNTSLEDAMKNIKNATGVTMMAGDTEAGEDQMVIATPTLRGYQVSTDKTQIRFAATISSINYEKAGFKYSVEYNGELKAENVTATYTWVWESLKASGTIEEQTAASMGGKYFTALVFNNVPQTGTLKLIITPIADAYEGTTYTVTIVDGVVTSVTPTIQ